MTWKIAEQQGLSQAERARQWRDSELERTDKFMMISDFPSSKDPAIRAYRQALRDWPDSPDFPANKPTLGA